MFELLCYNTLNLNIRNGCENMTSGLLLIGTIIVICILINKFVTKIPVPSLLIFIIIGMIFGENGPLHISFDNFELVNLICSTCLIVIMFFGGFSTNLKAAKPVIHKAVLMSTLGVILTALIVALGCHFLFNLDWLESFLIGSVISSTDAASVFNILKTKKLALKNHNDSLLEIESGSNDPASYMLTLIVLTIMSGKDISIPLLLISQIGFGVLIGLILAKLSIWLLQKNLLENQESRTVYLFGIMIISYALPTILNGNGYLSVYLCGLIIGNSKVMNQKYLVHFFDVLTNVSQVIIFFLLGLLVTPIELPSVFLPALGIMAILTIIARPLTTFILLAPFKTKFNEIGIISFAGLRGAASIVFAILAVLYQVETSLNIFNLVFCIVLISILIQGSLFPFISKKLSMIDEKSDINKTFTDYQDDSDVSFVKLTLSSTNPWCNHSLKELAIPKDLLIVSIIRNQNTIIPNGNTILKENDILILAAKSFSDDENTNILELLITKSSKLINTKISQANLSKNQLIILIKRQNNTIIPTGNTKIKLNDKLVIIKSNYNEND